MTKLLTLAALCGLLYGAVSFIQFGWRSMDQRHHAIHHVDERGKVPFAYPHCSFCKDLP